MIFEVDSIETFLLKEFQRRMRLNPRYSLRAFARALGLSSGALSETLRHQRPVSLKVAAKIAHSLGLAAAETKRLYELVGAEKRSGLMPLNEDLEQKQLDDDTFQLVSEWHHFAIINLLDCEDFCWNAKYIAKRLGLGMSQTQIAMDLLLRLGLVRKEGKKVVGIKDFVLAPAGISSAAIRQYHRQMLEKAIVALELQDVSQREMTGVGFAVDPDQLPQIKREISNFQDQLIAKHSRGKKREVYFFETALFRVTQEGFNGKN